LIEDIAQLLHLNQEENETSFPVDNSVEKPVKKIFKELKKPLDFSLGNICGFYNKNH